MNDDLDKPFEAFEVQFALNQMESSIAPGPNGLLPLFYKQFWTKVGAEVTDAVLFVLNSGTIPNNLNQIHLTLIPKVQSPRQVTDFKPISLSNVLYKLIAKVFANRLNSLLPKIISETQSGFMSERLIIDNILIAHETLHYLKAKRMGKLGYMALKLHMSKAYDQIE